MQLSQRLQLTVKRSSDLAQGGRMANCFLGLERPCRKARRDESGVVMAVQMVKTVTSARRARRAEEPL